ncbi:MULTISPECIES: preprotein translocase subunit SecY [Brochothrix]|uniref:Protein translocase subunit SecY n=1 Tax=Brochothrix thermosphacta TaxID=2756 RepID=A0A1D2JVC3_BROTH|nr:MULTISPECIES: preprotein translocase subunit SecY [Brochothrix]SLM91339.1 Preprotein translocase secY subunit (TC 3.A.5.1.1) [Brachybacterium faecium]ANZ95027.1 preprotein translocase subunit SecY [Brochothrix thermosphacta]ANZ96669.1 preprotein translocase subunit SecY [Brochothrix thermosphacta]ATF26086.1 preprotein translocase subunit SecY [Brochothrix thermosphacta]ATH85426.1 preprotein translocase subunit SecY [Brochothrix thermosphacta]
MFQTFMNFFKVKDIRRKILFTLALLIVFRIGAHIPIPGVDASQLKALNTSLVGFLDLFGGGSLSNFSIFAVGIMPYITASIIVQLLEMDVVPKFAEWAKQGEMGRRKLNQFKRYLTIALGLVQSFGVSYGFNNMTGATLVPNASVGQFALMAIILTTGTMFLMWMGEQITEKGIGNGVSIIIMAGIIANVPSSVGQLLTTQLAKTGTPLFITVIEMLLLVVAVIVIVALVVFVQQASRKIPVHYSKRASTPTAPRGAQVSHLPLKVNSAGVIPVIFASAFIITPQTLLTFADQDKGWVQTLGKVFNLQQPAGMVLYVILILAFTYFYAFIQVNPEKVAENLQKQGGYVPTIRPGKDTEKYLSSVLMRLTFVGSIFLAAIAILPTIGTQLFGLPQGLGIGGTSLLIMVGVALDTMKQLEGQLVKRNYRGFLK